MASTVTKPQVLSIYKKLLRESQNFPTYNFKMYAIRRIRDAFRENKNVCQPEEIQKQYQYANDNLNLIRRQVIVGSLYSTEQLVIETKSHNQQINRRMQ